MQSVTTFSLNNDVIPPVSLSYNPRIKTLAGVWQFTSINDAFLIWCYRNANFVFKNDSTATVQPVRSTWLLVILLGYLSIFSPTIHLSLMANQPWRYSISVPVDSWNFLCKCLPHMQKSHYMYNAHTKLLHEQKTTCPGLEITAGQWTMSELIWELTGQPFVLPVMLTGHIWLFWKEIN